MGLVLLGGRGGFLSVDESLTLFANGESFFARTVLAASYFRARTAPSAYPRRSGEVSAESFSEIGRDDLTEPVPSETLFMTAVDDLDWEIKETFFCPAVDDLVTSGQFVKELSVVDGVSGEECARGCLPEPDTTGRMAR